VNKVDKKMSNVRARFAPSPTGDLHIGGVRTALFNWLLARSKKGKFILRIDDTDEKRSTISSIKIILESMKWLKLDWDEGPNYDLYDKPSLYYQMERKNSGIYQKYVDELILKGLAYNCYCTSDEINKMREKAQINKLPPKYNGKCRKLTFKQQQKMRSNGKKSVVRFKVHNTGVTVLYDIVKGIIHFDNSILDDFVILKTNYVPTYNFACVIDDHLMNITYVLRGDDHISNTLRQIQVYKAFGWKLPKFAHIPMILGTDGERLSKRHGHTSILKYREEGYLYEAIINYLALQGWSSKNNQQIFTIEDLIKKFALKKCSVSPSIFDSNKLLWINAEKIRLKTIHQLCELFIDWLKYINNEKLIKNWNIEILKKAMLLEKNKIKLLKDIPYLVDFFFKKEVEYEKDALDKIFLQNKFKNNTKNILKDVIVRLRDSKDFSSNSLEKHLRTLAMEKSIKTQEVFHSIRIAITGRTKGPSLFHMMELMGAKEVIRRLNMIIEKFFKSI
jgi:glutamyl-tRNA synthetase